MSWSVVIPDFKLPSANDVRTGWAQTREANRARRAFEAYAAKDGTLHVPPLSKAKVTLTIAGPYRMDYDNRYTKGILDAIVARPDYGRAGKRRIPLYAPDGEPIRRPGWILDDSTKVIGPARRIYKTAKTYWVRIQVDPRR